MPPERVGHFQILDKIAAGGMGAVYRARDEHLGREVAVKLLLERAGMSTAARERMLREARVVAALNHPHICTLYEAGEEHGQPYLVMELLEGETLHARLARGAVGWEQAVAWGVEIADALQAAHAKGILHRDLKPGNIFLTAKAGTKVLDFGLARMDEAWAAAAAAEAPTLAEPSPEPLTERGTILGTLAYMPPEQARGEATDARSDVYSLGVVLYEMVAGRPPFRARTAADLTAVILREPPPAASSMRAGVPARLDDVIAQCLEKDPELRFQSAADLRAALRRLRAAASSTAAASPPASSATAAAPTAAAAPASSDTVLVRGLLARHRRAASITAAVIAVVIAALAWFALRPPAVPAASGWDRMTVDQVTNLGDVNGVALSPNGHRLAYKRQSASGGISLWLRDLRSGTSVELLKADAKATIGRLQFSPDGAWIYFDSRLPGTARQSLVRVSALGGARQVLTSPVAAGRFALSPDGTHLAYRKLDANDDTHLMVAAADGGGAHAVASMAPPVGIYGTAPAWSPDGRRIAFVAGVPGSLFRCVEIARLDGGPVRRLGDFSKPTIYGLVWLPGGSGVMASAHDRDSNTSRLWLLPLPTGAAEQITRAAGSYRSISVSRTGDVAAGRGLILGGIWVSPPGRYGSFTSAGSTTVPRANVAGWLADGSIAFNRPMQGVMQMWSMAADGTGAAPVTHAAAGVTGTPTPDGRRIVLNRRGARGLDLAVANASGGSAHPIPKKFYSDIAGAGNSWLVLNPAGHLGELERLPLSGGAPQPFTLPGYQPDGYVAVSFNGQWIAAETRTAAGGGTGVYHFGAHPGGAPVATLPAMVRFDWMPDNKTLVFTRAKQMWLQPVAGGPPRQLTHFTDGLFIEDFSVSPDGRLAVARTAAVRDAVILRPGRQ